LFATRPQAWQMNFGALTSGLMAFRSIAHVQQVKEHIFSVAQHFECFAMFFTILQLKHSIEPSVTLRPERPPAASASLPHSGQSS
jgi:hypothetical protein